MMINWSINKKKINSINWFLTWKLSSILNENIESHRMQIELNFKKKKKVNLFHKFNFNLIQKL
jgi:hypothetical protein